MARLVLDYCRHFPVGINDSSHRCDAKIVLIGEAPGRNEDERGVPFVGDAGFTLDGWLEKAGLNRRDLYITNVCVGKDTTVLMSDLSWKLVQNVNIGDKVLAFDEHGKTRGDRLRKWRIATVTATNRTQKRCLVIRTKSGESLTVTPEHKVLVSSRRRNVSMRWIQASRIRWKRIRVSHLCQAIRPWQPNVSREAGYLAGLFDGEGTLTVSSAPKGKRNLQVSFTQNEGNGVREDGQNLITSLGYQTGTYTEIRESPRHSCSSVRIKGGVSETLRFLGEVRPNRLLAKLYALLDDPPVIRPTPDRVIKVEETEKQDVYDLTTTTGTFIANGFCVHNCRRRPPNNEIHALGREVIEKGIEELHQRLDRIDNPYVITPTGDVALNALLQSDYGGRLRITDWRGSILSYRSRSGKSVKVIPTIHPAATFRRPILTKFCIADWLKIAGDSQFRELRLPERELIIDPNNTQVEAFIAATSHLWEQTRGCTCSICENALQDGCGPVMAIDVENSMKDGGCFDRLTCAGFSYDPRFAMTISTRRKDYGSGDTYDYALNAVRTLCESPIAKVLQNGLTDATKLHVYGINIHNYAYDLMEMDHALDPNDGGDTERGGEDAPKDKTFKLEMKSLKILTSLHTREPFYKLEGKLGPDFDWVRHMRYNAKDAAVTREICGVLYKKLQARRLV